MLKSNIVYKYQCVSCQDSYIGCSSKQSIIRFKQHLGKSFRTNRHLAHPPYSACRSHSDITGHPLNLANFEIIDSISKHGDLKILESIYIKKLSPSLNRMESSLPLLIT